MITRLIGQLTKKQLEPFFNNLSIEGRRFLKTLLVDEDNHINKLNMDYKLIEHRKLAMKPVKTDEEQLTLQSAPKIWAGRVDGKKIAAAQVTIDTVNTYLTTYSIRKTFLAQSLDNLQGSSELFFGVPIDRYMRDFKDFKRNLLIKTLNEPLVMRGYLSEYLDACNKNTIFLPFAVDEKPAVLAEQLDDRLFKEYQGRLQKCVVTSLSIDVISMLENLMMRSSQADKLFNEQVWRETQNILPIFHNQNLRYLYHFFSLFLFCPKTSVLPKSITNDAIVALIRKVEELC